MSLPRTFSPNSSMTKEMDLSSKLSTITDIYTTEKKRPQGMKHINASRDYHGESAFISVHHLNNDSQSSTQTNSTCGREFHSEAHSPTQAKELTSHAEYNIRKCATDTSKDHDNVDKMAHLKNYDSNVYGVDSGVYNSRENKDLHTNYDMLDRSRQGKRTGENSMNMMENDSVVKFSGSAAAAIGSAIKVIQGHDDEDVDSAFEGQTITLVADENNSGTFKVAVPGGDGSVNSVAVLNENQIVVFEHNPAVGSMEKESGYNTMLTRAKVEPVDTSEDNYVGISIRSAPDHHDNISTAYCNSNTNTEASLGEEYSRGAYALRSGSLGENCIGRNTSSQRDPPLIYPIPLERSRAGVSYSSCGSKASTFATYSSGPPHTETQAKAWHYSTEREVAPLPLQYSPESAYPGYPNAGMAMPHHGYQEYPPAAPAAQGIYPTYTELGSTYPNYVTQMNTWHSTSSHHDNMVSHTAPEQEQKLPIGYGHPHPHQTTTYPTAYASPYIPPHGDAYPGYPSDPRSWPGSVKSMAATGDASEATSRGGTNRNSSMYQCYPAPHQTASTPHIPVPHTVGRGWGGGRTYPTPSGWGQHAPPGPVQHPTRYMGSGRSRGTRSSTYSQRNAANNVSNRVFPPGSSAPLPLGLGSNGVGRPRKRTNNVIHTNVDKESFAGSNPVLYPSKDISQPPRKRLREPLPITSNVHTLKPGHIITWYIDYLIHENEDRTQISRAFTLPVNLFHTDDFYFLESLRKKIRFPSPKFLAWMQRHLPSINAHAIDFREGRPADSAAAAAAVGWNQDWAWQTRSKRDIIHDVFFFFQHRKAANTDVAQMMTRSKTQVAA